MPQERDPDQIPDQPADQPYVLGTHGEELERLRFQHELWRPLAEAAWERADLRAGERVLDLGAGPGFAAMDLARRVGPQGQVLALEHSPAYVTAGRRLAAEAGPAMAPRMPLASV